VVELEALGRRFKLVYLVCGSLISEGLLLRSHRCVQLSFKRFADRLLIKLLLMLVAFIRENAITLVVTHCNKVFLV
jgi:hypothetical protein